MQRGVLAVRTEVKLDADAGIEMNALQRFRECHRSCGESVAVIADGPFKHQGEPAGAIHQIIDDLRVGSLGIGQVDPLHYTPGVPRGPARDQRCLAGRCIEGLNGDAVITGGAERGQGRALERLGDQPLPIGLFRCGEGARQG